MMLLKRTRHQNKKMAEKRQTAVTTCIVWFLVALFLLVTIISQLVIHYYNPVTTEPAELYMFEDYVQATGVFIRNEKEVQYNGSGIINYVYSDGEKLAKNSAAAKIYSSRNDLELQLRIDELNQQIAVLKDAEKLVGSDNSQLEAFSNQIYENHSKILQNIIEENYTSAAEMKNEYLNLQSKKKIVSGAADNYTSKIKELEGQITSLSAQISSSPYDLILQETGYFVSSVDGYESVLTYDVIDKLTKTKIEEIIKNPVIDHDASSIGKIISDYKWKMVCVIPANRSMNIYKGAELNVRIGNNTSVIKGKAEEIKDLDPENKLLVIGFDVFKQELIINRTAQIRILFDEYSGIRIPSSAIHFDDQGRMGVFIKLGVNVFFRYIDVVRTENDYTLVKDTTCKDGYLSLYDSVITEGTDLRDGKIILQ